MDPELQRRLLLEALREGRIRRDQLTPQQEALLEGPDDPSLTDRVGGLLHQLGAGVGEGASTMALGVAKGAESLGLGRIAQPFRDAEERQKGIEDFESLLLQRNRETAPDQTGEGTARFIGRLGAEVAPAVAAGFVGVLPALFADAATGVSVSQAGPEHSTIAGIGLGLEALGVEGADEKARELAEDPLTRAIGEVAVVGAAEGLIRGVSRIWRSNAAKEAAEQMTRESVPDGRVLAEGKGVLVRQAREVEERVATDRRLPQNEPIRERIDEIDERLHEMSRRPEGADTEDLSPEVPEYNGILEKWRRGEDVDIQARDRFSREQAEEWRSLMEERELLKNEARQIEKSPAPDARAKAAKAFEGQGVFPSQVHNTTRLGDAIRWAYLKMVDIDKPFEWASVPGLPSSMDPKILARIRRRTGGYAMRVWTDGLRRMGLDETPRTMAPQRILEEYVDGDVQGLGYGMLFKREEELRKRGLGKRLTDEQFEAAKELYENDVGIQNGVSAFKEYWDEWLNLMEAEGVISKGGAKRIRKEGNYWFTPLKRLDLDKYRGSARRQSSSVSSDDPLHKLDIVDPERTFTYQNPVLTSAEATFAMADIVAKKRLYKSLAHIADNDLNPGMIRKLDDLPKGAEAIDNPNHVMDVLGEAGEKNDRLYKGLEEDEFIFRFVDEAGEENFYAIDKFLYESMREVDHAVINNKMAKALIAPGRTLRTGVTLTLGFQSANIFRDSLFVGVTEKVLGSPAGAPLKALFGGLNTIDELFNEALIRAGIREGEEAADVRLFELSGGSMSTLADMDLNRLHLVLDDMREHAPGFQANLRSASRKLRNVGHKMRLFGSISENANRLNIFNKVREQALEEGMDEIDANLLAAYRAGEASVDFSRRGRAFEESQWIKGLDTGTAFWRATIQSMDKVSRIAGDIQRTGYKVNAEGIKRLGVAGGTTLFAPALINYSYNRQNPDYFEVSKDIRSRYVLFDIGRAGGWVEKTIQDVTGTDADLPFLKQGDSLFFKVPVPHEVGWLFTTVPTRMLEEVDPANPYRRDDPLVERLASAVDPIGESLMALIGPFNPLGSSFLGTGPGALYQIGINTDQFRDQPIEPRFEREAKRQAGVPQLIESEQTGGLTRAAAEAMNKIGIPASPRQIEFGARSITGGLGAGIFGTIDEVFGSGEAVRPTERSILRRFFVDERSLGQPARDFYDEFFRLRGKINQSKEYENEGKMEMASRVLPEPEEIQKYHHMEVVYEYLADLNDAMEVVENDEVLSPDDKRRINDQIRDEAQFMLNLAEYDKEHLVELRKREEDEDRSAAINVLLQAIEAAEKQVERIRRGI